MAKILPTKYTGLLVVGLLVVGVSDDLVDEMAGSYLFTCKMIR
jgi:hypothetical protein